MKRILAVAAILLLAGGTGMAQVVLPKKAYVHFSGFIGEHQQVIVDFIKINDSIYCDFSYGSNSMASPGVSPGSPAPRPAGGRVRPDGSFTLREPFSDQGAEIAGRFLTRQTLTGTWTMTKGGAAQAFSLSEVYPDGSLPLNVYYQKGTKALIRTAKTPRAAIEQCLIVPGESTNPVISDTLSKLIIESYEGKNRHSNDPDTVLALVRDHFFRDYISSNEDLLGQTGLLSSMNWELLRMMHIVFNGHGFLSWYILSYAFTGGAHGLEMQEYSVADLKTGKRIALADLLIPNYDSVLSVLLTARLKESAGIKGDQKLSENGFFVDVISPTTNFYLTGEGLGFFYNHYDIAPYSNG